MKLFFQKKSYGDAKIVAIGLIFIATASWFIIEVLIL